ncbi:MAG: hypothetical protein HYV47_04020 [Candidatus Nealsonbacteria bacterium]|nr:hypothetical protein [Candidatus Nealsonbacteria bacterium]
MQNSRYKIIVNILIAISLALPSFGLAHGGEIHEELGVEVPQTVGEAGSLALGILQKLPEAAKRVWEGEAMPFWRNMWAWFLGLWNGTLGPIVEPWLNKEIGKRRPALERQFQEESKEMQDDLWQRFKDLLK